MILDLSPSGRLSLPHLKALHAIADRLRGTFTSAIENEKMEKNLDWWVSEIANRNSYATPLFLNCCYAVLVKGILEEGPSGLKKVITNSPPLARVIEECCRDANADVEVVCTTGFVEKFWWQLKPFHNYLHAIIVNLYGYILTRFFIREPRHQIPPQCTLIDIFMVAENFPDGTFVDRNYNHFSGCIDDQESAAFFFVPTIPNSLQSVASFFKLMQASDERFLLKEDYLAACDYVYALLFPFRALQFFPKKEVIEQVDVTPLFRSVWYEFLASGSSIEALLKYRFIRRLKDCGVSIRLAVDWFENQNIDKGMNAGLREYYPETPLVGYHGGSGLKYYLCMYPTREELKHKVIPPTVAVGGKGFAEEVKEFCPELDVIVVPDFRHAWLWETWDRGKRDASSPILVALPFLRQESLEILEIVIEVAKKYLPPDRRIWIKTHPVGLTMEQLLAGTELKIPANFEVVDGDFRRYALRADLVISSTSTVCLETLAIGVPVIVIGRSNGLTQNPIPDSVPNDVWRLCYTAEEARDALRLFHEKASAQRDYFEQMGRKIREEYFEPVSRDAVRHFLRLH